MASRLSTFSVLKGMRLPLTIKATPSSSCMILNASSAIKSEYLSRPFAKLADSRITLAPILRAREYGV